MSAVAARFVAGVFAGAEVSVFIFLSRKDVGNERRALVFAVAEGLPFRKSAGAERVFLSSFQRHFDGSFAGDRWFVGHGWFPGRSQVQK